MTQNVFSKKLKSLAIVSVGSFATFCGISYYTGHPKFYKQFIMPLVHKLDPEISHRLAVEILKRQLIIKPKYTDPESLKTTLWDLEFDNPIGLAAGFDKHGEAVKGLHKIGCGFVEVGSVTPKPQPGNPKPRVFRLLQDEAVINRYGFNSDGHEMVYDRLEEISKKDISTRGIIGVNLGKNKDSDDSIDDFVRGVRKFAPIADYLVINVSSPNTKNLRLLQRKHELEVLIDKVIGARDELHLNRKTPILVKIAPDLTQEAKEDIGAVLMRPGKPRVDGIIISNSTITRPSTLQSPLQNEDGGLTGSPLKSMSTDAIKTMYTLTKGEISIIGVGGISSGADAYEKIKAGASLLQIYTALVYQGFPVITRIKKELDELLKKDGYKSVQEAIGADNQK